MTDKIRAGEIRKTLMVAGMLVVLAASVTSDFAPGTVLPRFVDFSKAWPSISRILLQTAVCNIEAAAISAVCQTR